MPWTGTTTRATGFLVTAAVWNAEHVDNMQYLEEVGQTSITSNVSVTGTAFVDVISLGAIDYEAVPHILEFWCHRSSAGASGTFSLHIRDGSTDLGQCYSQGASAAAHSVSIWHRFTPTAASHTYKLSGINGASQTSTIQAGAGGAGVVMPAMLRIYRVPT